MLEHRSCLCPVVQALFFHVLLLHGGWPGWGWLQRSQDLELFHQHSVTSSWSPSRSVEEPVNFDFLNPSIKWKYKPREKHFNVLIGCKPQLCSAWLRSISSSVSVLLQMCHVMDLDMAMSNMLCMCGTKINRSGHLCAPECLDLASLAAVLGCRGDGRWRLACARSRWCCSSRMGREHGPGERGPEWTCVEHSWS